jgi:prophage regulatory protein
MRLLQFPELKPEKGIPFSRAHIWRLERANKFPKRVNLAERTVAWAEPEIDDWLAARIAERDGAIVGRSRSKIRSRAAVLFELRQNSSLKSNKCLRSVVCICGRDLCAHEQHQRVRLNRGAANESVTHLQHAATKFVCLFLVSSGALGTFGPYAV